MGQMTKTRQQIRDEIKTLSALEVHVATNQGTYSVDEACRKIGSGDPAFANREVYETVGGEVRSTGPSEDKAPGRMRNINAANLSDHRQHLAALHAMLRGSK